MFRPILISSCMVIFVCAAVTQSNDIFVVKIVLVFKVIDHFLYVWSQFKILMLDTVKLLSTVLYIQGSIQRSSVKNLDRAVFHP